MKKGLINEAFRLQQLAGIAPLMEIEQSYIQKLTDVVKKALKDIHGVDIEVPMFSLDDEGYYTTNIQLPGSKEKIPVDILLDQNSGDLTLVMSPDIDSNIGNIDDTNFDIVLKIIDAYEEKNPSIEDDEYDPDMARDIKYDR